jgi:Zn-dependent protease
VNLTPESVIAFALIAFSIILHEIAHGYAALKFGDETALRMDRLTLDPRVHIDEVGTLLLPAVQLLTMGDVYLGWAKPVPVNPLNLEPRVGGEIVVAIAGVTVNMAIALAMAILMGLPFVAAPAAFVTHHPFVWTVLLKVKMANIGLAVFNLLPVPPLDGSHVLKHFLPPDLREPFERIGFGGIALLFFLSWRGYLDPITTGPILAISKFLYLHVTMSLRGHA